MTAANENPVGQRGRLQLMEGDSVVLSEVSVAEQFSEQLHQRKGISGQ